MGEIGGDGHYGRGLSPALRGFLYGIVGFKLCIVLTVSVVNALKVTVTSIVTILTSTNTTVTLTIGKTFSGLINNVVLLVFEPVDVSSFIRVNKGSNAIRSIKVFCARLHAKSGLAIGMPGSVIISSVAIGCSEGSLHHLSLTLSITCNASVRGTGTIVTSILGFSTGTLGRPTPFIHVATVGRSSLRVAIHI